MAREPAPTKTTGGGGYGFEDRVACYYALHLLAATRIWGPDFGRIVKIDYQARDAGWLLDDLVVTLEDQQGLRHVAHSIRSNRQVTTTNGFPEDFVNDIWEQWLGRTSSSFQEGRDRLALAVGQLANTVRFAWDEMVKQARATSPDRFVSRFTAAKQSSALQRRLFASLGCPSQLADGARTDQVTAVTLLAHLELVHFDFEHSVSRDWAGIITVAQSVLESGDANEGAHLAETVGSLSSKLRPAGGVLDLPTLLACLRGRYRLKSYPDHRADWATLRARTDSALARTKSVIAHAVTLDRQSLRNDVNGALLEAPIVVLVGESGCGKSALVKALASSSSATTVWVWFGGEDLEGADLGAVRRNLGLQNRLEEVSRTSVTDRTVVVFDALDRASPASLLNACELMSRLHLDEATCPIRVLITTEPGGWGRIQREFVRLGINATKIKTWPVGVPDQAAVRTLLLQIPSLRAVADRAEIRCLLQNLKVLDWVAIAAEQGHNPAALSGVGVTQVIDWVWEYWIGDDTDALARSGLLKKLGEFEGDSISVGVALHGTLNNSEQQMLGSPGLQRLIRVKNERCYFLHDLAGDWARLRVLLGEQPDRLNLIVEKAKLPRWHRAIRYFGQRLLEATPGDPAQWETMLKRLGGVKPPSFAHDLVLEAVAFAANAPVLLEQVWPVLVANDGALLRRFLRLFLHSATIPDPRVGVVATSQSEANALGSMIRQPSGPCWFPMLRFLRQHHDDVAKYALGVTARVCRIWLETIPERTSDNRPFPGRREAAELAVRLARELQFLKVLRTYFQDNVDETVYESLLLAAPDLPNEVGSVVLEVAQRRDWNRDVLRRAKRSREDLEESRAAVPDSGSAPAASPARAKAGLGVPRGPLPDPWPDGPRRRIDDAFLKVCHEKSQAFMRLINASPAVAREVALAVCIEPPRPETYAWDSHLLNRCGLEHWSGGFPDAFFRGCFLTFLRHQPEVGLDLIITLVDFATERWVATDLESHNGSVSPSPEQLGPPILLPNGDRRHLLGNNNVYAWYRLGGLDNSAVACALMALERWFYDEVEAARDVSRWVNVILQRSRSVAFAGVLVAVGLKRPQLFTSVLSPVLSIWPLYEWQEHLVMNGNVWQIEMGSWARDGEVFFNLMRDWHTMPHRKISLRDTVVKLFVLNTELAGHFESIRAFWRSELDRGGYRESLDLLLARFDPNNYRRSRYGTEHVLIEFDWPESLRERTESALHESEEGLLLLSFPLSCRKILDSGDALEPEARDRFWRDTERIAHLTGSSASQEERSRGAASLCGAAAVLFTHHGGWLSENPAREKWLRDQLRSILASPPPRDELDVSQSSFPLRWDCFAGECLCTLLGEQPHDEWVRRSLASVVMAFHYDTTNVVMRSAFQRRVSLGDDWSRLTNLMVMWAGLRFCIARADTLQVDAARFVGWREHLVVAFVRKQIRTQPLEWMRIGRLANVVVSRMEQPREESHWKSTDGAGSSSEEGSRNRRRRRASRGHPGLDVQVLQAAFAWIPPLNEACTDTERTAWIRHVLEALGVTLAMLPHVSEMDDEVDGTPYDFDRWVFARCAMFVAQMRSNEEPERLWRPILDLGGKAHYWVSEFLSEWLINGVKASSTPEKYARRWKEMIEYALGSPVWSPNGGRSSFRTADLMAELMGLSWTGRAIGEAEFTEVIGGLFPQYRAFADQWLAVPHVASRFASFLQRPGAKALIRDGIKWLNARAACFHEYAWRDDGLEEAILEALRACWFECNTIMLEDDKLRIAFLELLDLLNKRQNAGAFELRDEVVRSIRQS